MKRLLPPYLLNGPALLIFAVMLAVLTFPLLLSSFMAIVLFFWWRRKARLARQEVANV